jgi:hypothetical protein
VTMLDDRPPSACGQADIAGLPWCQLDALGDFHRDLE